MNMKTIKKHKATSNALNEGMVSFVCLKMSKEMKWEKNTGDIVFILL